MFGGIESLCRHQAIPKVRTRGAPVSARLQDRSPDGVSQPESKSHHQSSAPVGQSMGLSVPRQQGEAPFRGFG